MTTGDSAPDQVLVERLWEAGCVFAEDEVRLLEEAAAGDLELLERMTVRRIDGEPLEYVVGWAEFDGHRYAVGPGVFVPRPRSEAIIEVASGLVPARDAAVIIADVCCGAGALGAALYRRAQRPELDLYACDLTDAAVACARANLAPLGAHVFQGDLFAPLPSELRGRIDIVVANVPYVPTADIELMNSEARDHEPHSALDGGPDGLDVYRRFCVEAAAWLAPGSSCLSEIATHQVGEALDAVRAAGLAARFVRDDEYEANVVIGTRPGA